MSSVLTASSRFSFVHFYFFSISVVVGAVNERVSVCRLWEIVTGSSSMSEPGFRKPVLDCRLLPGRPGKTCR